MKLVPCTIEEIGHVWIKKSDNYATIKEFIDSGLDCAKVENWHHKKASGCSWSLNNCAKAYGFKNIKAITRKENVFLIKIKENE